MYRGDYGLVGIELSMFSHKLEAQLRFQNIPWHWHFKTMERTPDIEARTGTHFIPALITPEKWMIHDTIALGPLLHDRFRNAPAFLPIGRQSGAEQVEHLFGREILDFLDRSAFHLLQEHRGRRLTDATSVAVEPRVADGALVVDLQFHLHHVAAQRIIAMGKSVRRLHLAEVTRVFIMVEYDLLIKLS